MTEKDEIIKQRKRLIEKLDYAINNLQRVKDNIKIIEMPDGSIMNNIDFYFIRYMHIDRKNHTIKLKFPSDKKIMKHLKSDKNIFIEEIKTLEDADQDYINENYDIIKILK